MIGRTSGQRQELWERFRHGICQPEMEEEKVPRLRRGNKSCGRTEISINGLVKL